MASQREPPPERERAFLKSRWWIPLASRDGKGTGGPDEARKLVGVARARESIPEQPAEGASNENTEAEGRRGMMGP